MSKLAKSARTDDPGLWYVTRCACLALKRPKCGPIVAAARAAWVHVQSSLTPFELSPEAVAAAGPARLGAAVSASLALLSGCSGVHAAPRGYAELVRQVSPSVVTVYVQEQREGAGQRAADRAVTAADYNGVRAILQRLLSGPTENPAPGDDDLVLGSGFIIREDGLIVTNRHVIANARTIQIKLADGREIPAKVVGADAPTDIALLKVTAGHLPVLRLGSSAKISVGEAVVAMGNPFGLGETVTAGIVSARGRTLDADPYIDFLQTDAAINRGNSGGPLLATDGSVIGVTSVIFSPNGGSVGLGFAIPAEIVASVIGELQAHGRVDRGYLGINAQAMTPALVQVLGFGVPGSPLITAVQPHGPSAKALLIGDVLLSLGSKPVTFATLGKITARLRPGATVEAAVGRDGHQVVVPLLIGQLPDPPMSPLLLGDRDTWVPSLKLGIANTTAEIRSVIRADDETAGLIITQLRPGGPGALAGLKVGDLITHAGTKTLKAVGDLAAVGKPSVETPLLLRVVRNGSASFIAITGVEGQ